MILYFSGTGNSRHIAHLLAEALDESVMNIAHHRQLERLSDHSSLSCIFVFPVYGWAPPEYMLRFIDSLKEDFAPSRIYFVAVCGDDTGKTGDIFEQHIRAIGHQVDGGFSITMPNTYVCLPGFDVDDAALEQLKLSGVAARVEYIAQCIKEGTRQRDCHEGKFAWLKTHVVGRFFRSFLMSPHRFCTVGETCAKCGRCVQVCPLGSIRSVDGKPVWGSECTHCLACYHACPKHAIDYAGQTLKKGQYRRFLSK